MTLLGLLKGDEVKVLDHGYVKYVAHMGSDESIIEAARMSTGKGFETWDKDAKLLEFLYKNKHMTPFEMCELAIEVQAPIMVFREWHRHRTQSYNEFSARYAQMPDLHYLPEPGRVQRQSTANKQGSSTSLPRTSDDVVGERRPFDNAEEVVHTLHQEQVLIYGSYDGMVKEGIAKEVARLNTPVSRYSKMRAKANLRNWLGFLLLRKPTTAQWEIRQYAYAVGSIIQDLWPRTYALFEEYDLYAKHLSRTEWAEIQRKLEAK